MMRLPSLYFLPVLFALALLPGCAPAYPFTETTCISLCRDSVGEGRVLVWSADPSVQGVLSDWVRDRGAQVIEPAQVQDAMSANQAALEAGPGLDEQLRRLGRLLGADRILAATVIQDSHPLTKMYAGYKEGHPRVTTVFDPTVTVRSFGVDRPTLYWNVTARGPAPTFFFGATVTDLTQTALRRVTCEADYQSQWNDETGCVRSP